MADTLQSSFADLANEIGRSDTAAGSSRVGDRLAEATTAYDKASKAVVEGYKEKASSEKPAIEEAKKALGPMPEPPKSPTLPPPPSVGLRAFLSPVQGESPESSIAKFIQGLGLLATGIGGLAKGDARASLAAMTGALKGWQEGDKERADRAFGDWKAATNTMLQNAETERQHYYDVLENKKLTFQQKMATLDLLARGNENDIVPKLIAKGDAEGLIRSLQAQQQHLDSVRSDMLRLQQAHDDKVRHDEETHRHNVEMEQEKIRTAEARLQEIRDRREDKQRDEARHTDEVLSAYTPDVLEGLGQQWALTGRITGVGYGRTGQLVKGMVVKAGIEWARQHGIDVTSLPSIQAEANAARQAVTSLDRQQAQVMSFVNNFDSAVKFAKELSTKVDRTGSPVFNRYLLKVRGQYAGDPEVTNFETQVNVIASEYAKIMVGSAQGDSNTRAEARNIISAALTPEQFIGVTNTLLRDTEFRRKGYEQEKQTRLDFLKDVGAPKQTGAGTPPSVGTIRIRKKGSTSKDVYEAPAGTKIPDGYEAVK